MLHSKPEASFVNYPHAKDDIYDQPVNLMSPKKMAHIKEDPLTNNPPSTDENWAPFDFSKFDDYLTQYQEDDARDHNRLKRSPKRRRGRTGKRRNRSRFSTPQPDDSDGTGTKGTTDVPVARGGKKKNKKRTGVSDTYQPPVTTYDSTYTEIPKDLYQAHLRPGVIFRIHMAEAILKMQYRNYPDDRDESVVEADVEYLRLTRKVINDEITKFEDLKWLIGWFNNRSDLIQEHTCNTRYFAVGIPPTMFTHSEEYMKRMCLFDNVYIDHIPYVVGEDNSLMAAVAPPVLHCDAATCTSVPFIDSLMFDERLPHTNVRTVTRCQASCRAHCRNDPDCLKRCSDRCLRSE
ncbi:uncharacterized protein LOC113226085 [Hyposmocoma kahamanoa]|uniref:uncharacterized protein LOC113226085 n=1 Tax=Hyposmocoma kahamanoa TaxID=1477025 RepID=UPI000E6D6895|nr:uncharacterized protein LOC113226085 [Hyposmocoma kahamanoa]